MLDAVLREVLSVLIARDEVLLVVLVIASDVRLLYASARRSVVACYRKAYDAAVGESYLLLYEALAE